MQETNVYGWTVSFKPSASVTRTGSKGTCSGGVSQASLCLTLPWINLQGTPPLAYTDANADWPLEELVKGSTVLGFSLSDGFGGRDCFTPPTAPDVDVVDFLVFPELLLSALEGGVAELRDPAEPRELVRLGALPGLVDDMLLCRLTSTQG